MNFLRYAIILSAVIVLHSTDALGDQWTSSDGVIAVTAPDTANFQRIANPPEPFLAFWVSEDTTLTLGVVKIPLPPNVKLNRSSVEEEIEEEMNATITYSNSVKRNGHEIWIISGKVSVKELGMLNTQAILRHENNLYKVMMTRVEIDGAEQVTIDTLINSIEINQPNPGNEFVGVSGDDRPGVNAPVNWDEITGKIGAAGVLLLIVIFALRSSQRNAKKRSS